MRKTAFWVLLFALLLCGFAEPDTQNKRLYITATDLHYLAPALTDHGAAFTALTESGDGKLMRYIEEVTDAFLAEVTAQKPEALILTGDLTFNGALLSHTTLAEKLRAVEAEGVPVYVLPGNHDLDNPNAAAFTGESYRLVPSAAAADFRRIYADFGFDEALSCDDDSLSYIVQLNGATRLLMLDFNTAHDPCGVSDKTLQWVEAQLRSAREAGQSLCLSGHLHCQHWKSEQGITEITTGALSVQPCQYGVLTESNGTYRYETRETDVAARAAAQGSEDRNLLDFPQYAQDWFDARNRAQTSELLSLLGYTDEQVERMTTYIVMLNRAYFAGDLRSAAAWDPDSEIYDLFARFPVLYTDYLDSARSDFGRDFRQWESGMQ